MFLKRVPFKGGSSLSGDSLVESTTGFGSYFKANAGTGNLSL
jgi:hypothetical protein